MLELDPRIAKAIASGPSGQVVAETLSMMRAASNKPSAPPSPGIERQDYTVEGDPTVVIRVHRPADAESRLPGRLLDARGRVRVGQLRHRRRAARRLGQELRLHRRIGGLPPALPRRRIQDPSRIAIAG